MGGKIGKIIIYELLKRLKNLNIQAKYTPSEKQRTIDLHFEKNPFGDGNPTIKFPDVPSSGLDQ